VVACVEIFRFLFVSIFSLWVEMRIGQQNG
jgi:hypothetical protein